MPGNHLFLTRNEQVSGSSPLVGSSFCCDLQEKRKSGRTPSSLSYSNRTATRAWLRSILRPQQYIAYSLSREVLTKVVDQSSITRRPLLRFSLPTPRSRIAFRPSPTRQGGGRLVSSTSPRPLPSA